MIHFYLDEMLMWLATMPFESKSKSPNMYINKYAEEAGHIRLSTISQSKVRTILEEADIKPNKITYYCENRVPDFEQKMHNVLLVYKQQSLQFDENGKLFPFSEDGQAVHVLSYDEKPGIQAIATTTDDLPTDETHKTFSQLYVLDEPSIGLHPKNIEGLTGVMDDLVADGNSIVLVDHDTQVLSHADWLIELGPKAGAGGIRQGKLIGATPIGINVRSTVATYANVHDELRKVYAKTKDAKERGYKAGDFSYNTGDLRCPTCDGTGTISLDVQFLPDVDIPCPDCKGSRYSRHAYAVKRAKREGSAISLPELMALSVDEKKNRQSVTGCYL